MLPCGAGGAEEEGWAGICPLLWNAGPGFSREYTHVPCPALESSSGFCPSTCPLTQALFTFPAHRPWVGGSSLWAWSHLGHGLALLSGGCWVKCQASSRREQPVSLVCAHNPAEGAQRDPPGVAESCLPVGLHALKVTVHQVKVPQPFPKSSAQLPSRPTQPTSPTATGVLSTHGRGVSYLIFRMPPFCGRGAEAQRT